MSGKNLQLSGKKLLLSGKKLLLSGKILQLSGKFLQSKKILIVRQKRIGRKMSYVGSYDLNIDQYMISYFDHICFHIDERRISNYTFKIVACSLYRFDICWVLIMTNIGKHIFYCNI